MDDYTDTKIDTDTWTTLGVSAQNVVSKLAAGERIGKSPPAASPLRHAAEWMESLEDEFHPKDDQRSSDDDPENVPQSETIRFGIIDFGFVFILMWHRRQPFVWVVGIQISACA